jgi:hypothetical protein
LFEKRKRPGTAAFDGYGIDLKCIIVRQKKTSAFIAFRLLDVKRRWIHAEITERRWFPKMDK